METKTIQRRYDLDWLRVLAILGIFIFHCTRFFDTDDWAIKNQTTYMFVNVWKQYTNIWGMPLILIISGASVFYALGKFSPGKYIKGIVLRLFVPLVVGMFTHIAFQVYLERLHKGEFSGSFFEFYPHYFDGMYAFGGNFAWMGLHLWYLEILLILSLLFLPLFLFFKKNGVGRHLLKTLGDVLAFPGGVLLFVLPVLLLLGNLDEATWGNRDMGGWSVVIYPCFFIAGFVIVSHERLQAHIQRMRWLYLGLGMLSAAAYLFFEFQLRYPQFYSLGEKLVDPLLSLSVWCWLLAVFGFGMKRLNFSSPLLKYANEAVLPFYILHQSMIVTLGYFVVQWAIPGLLKFLFILSVSFLISMGLYEFLVRRFDLLRFLFGMKPPVKAAAAQPQESQVIEPA